MKSFVFKSGRMAESMNAVVAQRIEVSPGLIILRVVATGWQMPRFQAGQYGALGLPGRAKRHRVSDKGLFTLKEVPVNQNIVLISTGTGLAPYMSMLRTSLTCGQGPRYAVLHGPRHSWNLGYRSELMTLSRMCSNFSYLPSISQPDEETIPWSGATGYVQDLWTEQRLTSFWEFEPDATHTHIFLCGNPAMIETWLETLEGEGFQEHSRRTPGQIHIEKHWW